MTEVAGGRECHGFCQQLQTKNDVVNAVNKNSFSHSI